jgi:hypothetical protein
MDALHHNRRYNKKCEEEPEFSSNNRGGQRKSLYSITASWSLEHGLQLFPLKGLLQDPERGA